MGGAPSREDVRAGSNVPRQAPGDERCLGGVCIVTVRIHSFSVHQGLLGTPAHEARQVA